MITQWMYHLQYSDYLDYINELPYSDEPGIFGMHSNVNITKEQSETKLLLQGVVTAQVRWIIN